MATIKDISRVTGLSVGTISKYLNNKPVLPENSAMIQQAIESLHYQVNTFARGLKTSRTQTVGFLMHHWESPFFLHIISIVEERLHEHGYSVMVCAYNGDEQQEKEKLQLLSTRCDALVVHPLFLTAAYLQEHLTRALPVISIDRPLPGYNCDNILINTSSAGYSAVESLVQRGHRHIALLTGTRGLDTSTARVRAYERVFEDYGLPINRELILFGDYRAQTGFDIVSRLLRSDDRPTAIYATTNEMTLGALASISKFGLSIPEDMSFIGGDIIGDSAVFARNLSQVLQPADAFGETLAAQLIKRLFEKEPSAPETIHLQAEYLLRDSVRTLGSD